MVIFLYIVWITYMLLEGIREAYYWHFHTNTNKPIKFEIHPLFLTQRSIVAILILLPIINIGILNIVLFSLSCVLISPLIHNGFYYLTRNKIDKNVYPKKFLDQSSTSTAKLTRFEGPIFRIVYGIISITLLILTLVL